MHHPHRCLTHRGEVTSHEHGMLVVDQERTSLVPSSTSTGMGAEGSLRESMAARSCCSSALSSFGCV